MALLAVTRVSPAGRIEDELPIVSQLTGLTPYEARLRLVSPPPVVLARGMPTDQAQHWLSLLRARGHGAVAADERALPKLERALVPCDFELRSTAFVAIDGLGRAEPLPVSEWLALVRAVEVVEEARTVEKVDKKLALGRAVLTGGLLRSKEVRTASTDVRTDAERTLYLFRRSGPDPVVFRERSLRYGGLGERRAVTEHASFDRLVAWLRAVAPAAYYDERLCAHKRRPTLQAVSGTAKEHVALSTGAEETMLAAFLLVHAHLQGQL